MRWRNIITSGVAAHYIGCVCPAETWAVGQPSGQGDQQKWSG